MMRRSRGEIKDPGNVAESINHKTTHAESEVCQCFELKRFFFSRTFSPSVAWSYSSIARVRDVKTPFTQTDMPTAPRLTDRLKI